jgi:predicted phage terminase large subunit-like protein
VKVAVWHDTFPKVMRLCFPDVQYREDKTDWYVEFPNGSQIWFGGLDDKERTEKVLGQEHASIFLNECSQIQYDSRSIAVTRLAQQAIQKLVNRDDAPLRPRMYYDCNPPSKKQWTYQLFIEKLDPDTRRPVRDPQDYASLQMNPQDNAQNLAPGYIDTLQGLSGRLQRRFLKGEFGDATPGALWPDEVLDKWRVIDGGLPDMQRIAVGVDPSGSGDEDNAGNDEIGIIVAGLGADGNGYVLEDVTIKAGPATWGKVATGAYDRHSADVIVAEGNFGGAMVKHVIQTARPRTPFKLVTASRGKVVRAEPIAALFENGKARLAGEFRALEDELASFSTAGYMGDGSPNRADAMVWALSELFPGMTREKQIPRGPRFAQVDYDMFGDGSVMYR